MFKQILGRLPRKPSKSSESRESSSQSAHGSTASSSNSLANDWSGAVNNSSDLVSDSALHLGYNQGSKTVQVVSPELNINSVVATYEALPGFRGVSNSEKQNLFIKKLNLCCVAFDFTDPPTNLKEKDIKPQTLVELVDMLLLQMGSSPKL